MANVFKNFFKGIFVQNENDKTKKIGITVNDSATTGTTTTLESIQTTDRTLTFPDATDTLVAEATTQILTNKTIDGDNNTVQDLALSSLKTDLTNANKFIERDALGDVVSGKTVPGGSVVGDTDTQTLTNKTIDGTSATGTNTISIDADDAIYDNSTSGLTATDLQAAVDEVEGRLDTIETGKLEGPGTHGDNLLLKTDGTNTNNTQVTGLTIDDLNNVTGVNDLTVGGDLTVNGTATTLNTATLDVEDTNITVNNGGTDGSAEGAGLTVERTGTDGSFIYEDALASKFKLGALGSEVEVVNVSSSQTITNKDLSNSTNNIDTASSDSFTRATGNAQVVTIPDTASPDNFVLETFSQTITNKDIDGGTASNTNRITLPKNTTTNLDALTDKEGTVAYDTNLDTVVYNDGTQWNRLTSEGATGINYVPNSDGETGVTGYNAYDDTNAVPVDGTGGSPSGMVATPVTIAAEVLRGSQSIGLVKSSGDQQGEGISIDLDPFDVADRESVVQVSFRYKNIGVTPTNYNSGDIKVYVYDIDNATLIGAVQNDENGDLLYSDNGLFIGQFTTTDADNYRLIFHITTTNTLAWAVSIDEVTVGPINLLPATYQNQETIDLTGSGDFTAGNLLVSRIGNHISALSTSSITFSSNSTPASATGAIPEWARPSSNVFNVPVYTTGGLIYRALISSSGQLSLRIVDFSGSLTATTTDSNTTNIHYSVEDTNNIISNNKLNQESINIKATLNSGSHTSSSSYQTVIFNTEVSDDFNSYNPSTGEFTVPRTGKYLISTVVSFNSNSTGTRFLRVFIDGVSDQMIDGDSNLAAAQIVLSGSSSFELEKGQVITIRAFQDSGGSLAYTSGDTNCQLSIQSIPDFTTYGVLNPNSDYIEAIDTANSTGGSSLATWYTPNPSFTIQLTPGTWDLSLMANILMIPNVGGSVASHVALSTSSTPGLGILVDRHCANHGTPVGDSVASANIDYKNYVVTTTTDIYVQIQGTLFSSTGGTPTSVTQSLRNDIGSGGVLSARRIK